MRPSKPTRPQFYSIALTVTSLLFALVFVPASAETCYDKEGNVVPCPTPTPTSTPTPTPTVCLDKEGNEIPCPPCEPPLEGCPPGQTWDADECECLPDGDPPSGCVWVKCVPDHGCDGEFGEPCGEPNSACSASYIGAWFTAPGPSSGGMIVRATCSYSWSVCRCSSTGSFCWPVPGEWLDPHETDLCLCADPGSSCD